MNKTIKKEFYELNKIQEKLNNYQYLKTFLRFYLDNHEEIGTSYIKLIDLFTKEYGDININYDIIPENIK